MVSSTANYKFFILRNNDLGDVLVSTPLANGLRQAFPNSKISIGTGDWARPLLENNPHIDDIISCNAPWHNKQICNYPANSLKTFFETFNDIIPPLKRTSFDKYQPFFTEETQSVLEAATKKS